MKLSYLFFNYDALQLNDIDRSRSTVLNRQAVCDLIADSSICVFCVVFPYDVIDLLGF